MPKSIAQMCLSQKPPLTRSLYTFYAACKTAPMREIVRSVSEKDVDIINGKLLVLFQGAYPAVYQRSIQHA